MKKLWYQVNIKMDADKLKKINEWIEKNGFKKSHIYEQAITEYYEKNK